MGSVDCSECRTNFDYNFKVRKTLSKELGGKWRVTASQYRSDRVLLYLTWWRNGLVTKCRAKILTRTGQGKVCEYISRF